VNHAKSQLLPRHDFASAAPRSRSSPPKDRGAAGSKAAGGASADHSLATVVDREGVATVRPATSDARSAPRSTRASSPATGLDRPAARALPIKMKSGATLILDRARRSSWSTPTTCR
jgi:hypothetical protein